MPKAKGKDAIRSRFRVTSRGKVVHARSNKRHLMAKKSSKRRLRLGRPATLNPPMAKVVKKTPYMGG